MSEIKNRAERNRSIIMLKFLRKFGFTLIEVLVVVIIVGILAAIALPQFGVVRESSYDKEADVTLKIIQAAEKIYHVEYPPSYYPSSYSTVNNATNISSHLRLSLPNSGNWEYYVTTSASSPNQVSCAKRTSGTVRAWKLNITSNSTFSAGNCP